MGNLGKIARGHWKAMHFKHDPKTGLMLPEPYKVFECDNSYVNSGGALMLDLIAGAGGQAFDNGHAYIGVGDSTAATTATMTNLQASTNKFRQAMDASFPSRSGQVMTWQATFGPGDAEWGTGIQEGGLFNHPSAGTMGARIVQNQGVKAAGTSMIIQYTIHIP